MTIPTRVARSGSGEPVVLIHGVGLDLGMWDELAQALDGACEVIRYDMLGHGATPLPDGQPGLDAYVAQLAAVIEGQGLRRPCVIGYSMGGLVAGCFAASHPAQVSRLVLMSTVFQRDAAERQAVQSRLRQAEGVDREAAARGSIERWFSPAFGQARPGRVAAFTQRLLANRQQDFLAAYRLFASGDEILPEAAPLIACPTLVMTGALDPGSTPRMAADLAAAIPRAVVDVVPDQKHMLPVENASRVAGALKAFLGEGAGDRAA
ncbi:alpha/beta fold hydrolase [Bordetella sp. BOR01]|uniref:alpha/beta fold hydrolase n=1 Tax=Bordetella sp. BOR01 TaxID=2854779 RepID=UPI001C4727DD|nr:alpha/beta fold hydrolase [Bordetella sp. BOR01]MBV7483316.1 alpha/beta fold hydrolase [Bordetella sp. BOR01]